MTGNSAKYQSLYGHLNLLCSEKSDIDQPAVFGEWVKSLPLFYLLQIFQILFQNQWPLLHLVVLYFILSWTEVVPFICLDTFDIQIYWMILKFCSHRRERKRCPSVSSCWASLIEVARSASALLLATEAVSFDNGYLYLGKVMFRPLQCSGILTWRVLISLGNSNLMSRGF